MPFYLADLHIHSALSPCADILMSPPAIVKRCAEACLSVIAITDHNSAGNVLSMVEAAKGLDLAVIPGIEAQTSEDIHIVLLFTDTQTCVDFDNKVIRPVLPRVKNRPALFGDQYLMDPAGRVIGEEGLMLSGSLRITIRDLMVAARSYGALCVAAHADRPAHGYLYTMGMVAPDAIPDCFEFRSRATAEAAAHRWLLGNIKSIVSSDAHMLSEIVPGRTAVDSSKPGFDGLREAMLPGDRQKVVVLEDMG